MVRPRCGWSAIIIVSRQVVEVVGLVSQYQYSFILFYDFVDSWITLAFLNESNLEDLKHSAHTLNF